MSVPESLSQSSLALPSSLNPRLHTQLPAWHLQLDVIQPPETQQNSLSFPSSQSVSALVFPIPVTTITIHPVVQGRYMGVILNSLPTPYIISCQVLWILLPKYFSPCSLSLPTSLLAWNVLRTSCLVSLPPVLFPSKYLSRLQPESSKNKQLIRLGPSFTHFSKLLLHL